MRILGIGGQGYRDSSVAVVVDGRVAAAASEGRFTRVKHQGGFPRRALAYCLAETGLSLDEIDRIAVANNPWLNLRDQLIEWYGERFLETPRFKTFHIFHDELHAAVSYLAEVEVLRQRNPDQFRVVKHHLCHLAEAYLLSPFPEAAILGVDGRGEISTSSRGVGKAGRIEVFSVEEMPNSIGLLCAAVADFLGFRDEDDEFRIMSISSLGEPRYLEIFRRILSPVPGGGYALSQEYFDTFEGRAFLSSRFSEELGPGRDPGGAVDERHADIAASLQRSVEETVLHMAAHLHELTALPNLCLSGGVAQNWVLGGRIRADGPFENIHTGFAPGDEGTAIGAAMLVQSEEAPVTPSEPTAASALGPATGRELVKEELRRIGLAAAAPADPVADAAARLADGRIIGWFEGRLEFGPRALGHRSIFLDPTNSAAKERLVETVKSRARYHPFGIAVLQERLGDYFEDVRPDPHMASHRTVREEAREALAPILHADGTARVQTVADSGPSSLPDLLRAVAEKTGHPVLLNTSLNVPGKPLAGALRDALETFFTTGLDDIYLDGIRLSKDGGIGMTLILDGKATAKEVRAAVKDGVAEFLSARGRPPGLAVVLVGDDPASAIYTRNKAKMAKKCGMHDVLRRLPTETSEEDLLAIVRGFNRDPAIDGILVQLPLPGHIDPDKVVETVDPGKDADGFQPVNVGRLSLGQPAPVPCTPKGVMTLLDRYEIDVKGMDAVILGRSNIVGKPMSMLLTARHATVTVCHSRTRDLREHTRRADLVVSAMGRPRMITGDHVKEGVVAVDVGINRLDDGSLVGDLDFDQIFPKARAVTPVPGGVGPMTIATLLSNVLDLARARG